MKEKNTKVKNVKEENHENTTKKENKTKGVYQTEDDKYNVDKRYRKKRIQKKGFENKATANKYMKEEMKTIDKRFEEDLIDTKKTLNDCFNDLHSSCYSNTAQTQAKKKNDWNREFSENIGKIKIVNLYEDDVKKAINRIQERRMKKMIQEQRTKRLLKLLETTLEYTIDKGYVSPQQVGMFELKNAIKNIKIYNSNNLEKRDSLSHEEFEKFLKWLKVNYPEEREFAFYIYLLERTGCRISEARGLKFKDLKEFQRDCYNIRIERQLLEVNVLEEQTKTKIARTREVSKSFAEAVLKRKRMLGLEDNDEGDESFILRTEKQLYPYSRKWVNLKLKKYVTLYNRMIVKDYEKIPMLTCHSFRRTNANYLNSLMDLDKAAKLNGHTKQVLQTSYMRVEEKDREDIASLLNAKDEDSETI